MSRVDRLEWVNTHVSFAFSDRERISRENHTMDTMNQVKDSMHSIFVQAVGLQAPMQVEVFGLNRTSEGGIDTLLFIVDMRLDVANHTVVADAFVLPTYTKLLEKIDRGLQSLFGKLCQVNVSDDECIAWKVLLPSLVERCRTWKHTPNCAYTAKRRVPLSTEHGSVPICDCGRGKVTDAFRRRKEWAPFLPYVTRVALSPLFAVSYLEPVAGGLRDSFESRMATEQPKKKQDPPTKPKSGPASYPKAKPSTAKPPPAKICCTYCESELMVENAMKCSKCKRAVYCNRECQVNDWKEHKSKCKK